MFRIASVIAEDHGAPRRPDSPAPRASHPQLRGRRLPAPAYRVVQGRPPCETVGQPCAAAGRGAVLLEGGTRSRRWGLLVQGE